MFLKRFHIFDETQNKKMCKSPKSKKFVNGNL